MEYKLIIDKQKQESIVVTVHQKNTLVNPIEAILNDNCLTTINCFLDNQVMQVKQTIFYVLLQNVERCVHI